MRTQDLIVRPTSPNGWGKAALWIFVLTLAGLIWTVGLASWASAEARAATSCESKPGFYIKSFTASRGEVTCTYERLAPPQTAPTASQQADTSRAARLQQARDQYCTRYPWAPYCQPPVQYYRVARPAWGWNRGNSWGGGWNNGWNRPRGGWRHHRHHHRW